MIRENIMKLKERISSACFRVNRNPNSISIVAVAKGRTAAQIKDAIEAGLTDIGENRIQEALIKYSQIKNQGVNGSRIRWHMVGHLQRNKVKEAVEIFDLIHSVDSLRLAEEIDKQASRINKVQDILIQVNTSGEETKFGIEPEFTAELIKGIIGLNNINIRGLMTIAPMVVNPEKARPYFRILRELKDKINELRITNYELRDLSMGMTDDFEIAIEEGANVIRIGRAIFQ